LALWRAAAEDLSAYQCERCPRTRRGNLGCHGGAPALYYSDRPEATDTCPRRHLKRNPDLGAAFDLWAYYDGIPRGSLAAMDALTEPALDALWTIHSAVEYRRKTEEAARKAQEAAQAAARGIR
jgi:hypothetical protein